KLAGLTALLGCRCKPLACLFVVSVKAEAVRKLKGQSRLCFGIARSCRDEIPVCCLAEVLADDQAFREQSTGKAAFIGLFAASHSRRHTARSASTTQIHLTELGLCLDVALCRGGPEPTHGLCMALRDPAAGIIHLTKPKLCRAITGARALPQGEN